MSYASAVLVDGPRIYLKFNEGSGISITDYSGNNLTATTHGTPVMTNPGPIPGETCMTCVSASGQYADVPDDPLINLGDILSIEVWHKRTSIQGSTQFLVSKGNNAYDLAFYSDKKVYMERQGLGDFLNNGYAFTDFDNWHHIVATKNGSTRKMFIDAVDVTTLTANQTCLDVVSNLFFGTRSTGGSGLDGSLAHAALYPAVLSPAAVLAHYYAMYPIRDPTSLGMLGTGRV